MRLEKYISDLTNNTNKSLISIVALGLLFFVGIGSVHLFDWDEINFAESAREMIESGNFLRVQINFEPFWEKPPFFFWLQVLAMKAFGVTEFAARFPNALMGIVYLITFYLIGKKHFDGKFGWMWAMIFGASLLPHMYFKSGIIDPVFNYFIFMSIYFIARVISGQDKTKGKLALLSGLFSGLSVITKGPVGFLLLGMACLVYLIIRRFKGFPSLKYILIFLVGLLTIIGIWLSIEVAQNGWDIIEKFIAYQVDLFNRPVAGHEQPFYYHFVVVFLGVFPSSILALPYILKRKETVTNDLLLWNQVLFWTVIILFSIVTTKIIHYSSMTYVPLSFIAAFTLYKAQNKELNRKLTNGYIFLGTFLGVVFILLPMLFIQKELLYPYLNDPFALASFKSAKPWVGYEPIFGVILIVIVIISARLLRRNRKLTAVSTAFLGTTLIFIGLMLFVAPKIEATTQGDAIRFYQSKANEDCYIESYGYHSYATYFYGKVAYGNPKESKELSWLFDGPVDKDVYIATKINNTNLDNHPNLRLYKVSGGFKFYHRPAQR